MPQAQTKEGNIIKSSETSVWLAYDRTGFIVLGNPPKSPTGLHGSAKRPHGNASASSQKSDVSTDGSGTVVETLDYYPYGAIRLDNSTGTPESRKFIGMPYDSQTQLSLLGARYYNGAQGQFISQDPVFLSNPAGQNLANPQSLNAYSYSLDNPIVIEDPSGKLGVQSIPGAISGILSGIANTLTNILNILQHPVSTVVGIGSAVGSAVQHPAATAQSIYNSGASTVQTFMGASDYEQGRMLGGGAVFVGGFLVPGADEAEVAGTVGDAAEAADTVQGVRRYSSFEDFKAAEGPAGSGMQWHHIVEQGPNAENFAPEMLHSTENIVAVPTDIHQEISGYYSSIPEEGFTGGQTVRNWISTQSFADQTEFGQSVLDYFTQNE